MKGGAFSEGEWKILRRIHLTARDRFYERVLAECDSVISSAAPARDRYRRVFKLLRERDEELAFAFDDMRRSRAIDRLAAMRSLGVVTDEELAEFSLATRRAVEHLLSVW